MRRVEVLLPVALDRAFTYLVPDGMEIGAGDLVRVPLGGRQADGVVWGEADDSLPAARLKPVLARHDLPPLPAEIRRFVDWVCAYTLSPHGMVLRMALRGARDMGPEPVRRVLVATGRLPERATSARERVLAVAGDGMARAKADLVAEAGVSAGVIDGLVKEGALEIRQLPPEPVGRGLDPDHDHPVLSADQAAVARALVDAVSARAFSTHLLDGVTGAGKTETYLEAAAQALRLGRQVLVLLPEIALTRALIDRVAKRFGAAPAEWHSTVPPRRRGRVWAGVSTGETQIVIGARSALFLPFRDLGLIVVDEEHDAGFKQEEMPVYHGRDMAVVRGQMAGAPVVLVSATPSIETRVNAETGRYVRHVLPERFGGRPLPAIELVDLVADPPERGRWISPRLETAARETLGRGEQVLFFLNRRGYAPLTVCRACGHRLQCPNCTAWLVEHRFRGELMCHHCGHHEPVPHACPSCEAVGKLAPVGPGVERIREEAKALFPEARLAVLSSDIVVGAERIREEIDAVARHDVDLIIGTQLVTKGHNFPDLTLVGVVDADLGLGTADPRAAERTFQLLEQVTGRAGRGERPGRGLVQTHDPRHPVLKALAAHDREAFYAAEIEGRAAAQLPPFGRMASIVVTAATKNDAETHARAMARRFPEGEDDVRLLGPAEAPIAMIRGRHRIRLIVRAPRTLDLSGFLRRWIAQAPAPTGNVMVQIDIDPVSFL